MTLHFLTFLPRLPYYKIHRNGIRRIAYLVSFPCFFHIVGPNPIANSFTFTLHSFATIKCPASCISIKNPSKNIIFMADIIIVKFTPPLNKRDFESCLNNSKECPLIPSRRDFKERP